MTARFSGGGKEPEETGIDAPTNGNNQNGNGNGNGNSNGGSNGGGVSEGTLHKWFKGSKSKDGKGGWVNVVTGGTCASDEPGEGTPKCVSSAKRASMSKAARLSAQRRKKEADPRQQQKTGAAKPTYVSTDKKKMKKEEMELLEYSGLVRAGIKVAGKRGGRAVQGGLKSGKTATKNAIQKKEAGKGEKVGKVIGGVVGGIAGGAAGAGVASIGTGIAGGEVGERIGGAIGRKFDKKKMKKEEVEIIDENVSSGKSRIAKLGRVKGKVVGAVSNNEKDIEYRKQSSDKKAKDKAKSEKVDVSGMSPFDTAMAKKRAEFKAERERLRSEKKKEKEKFKGKRFARGVREEVQVTEAKDKKGKGSGTKDACYHKVKSRYSVWPSAYASGALVKCRKVGAANWGNSTKKESYELSNWRDDFKATEYEFVDLIKPEPIKGGQEQIDEGQKCWKGYEKKGTKKMFGKTYNNCVKKEETEIEEKKDPCWDTHKQVGMKKKGGKMVPNCVPKEEKQIGGGNLKKLAGKATKRIDADTDGDVDTKDMNSSETGEFVPSPCGNKKLKPKVRFEQSDWRSDLGEDWQKVNKSDKTDGMSQKAVNAYRRENPGSKLKTAVTGNPKKGSKDAKRRSSYCSRSEGQKDMHNIDCTKTPDKAICKARRRWKC